MVSTTIVEEPRAHAGPLVAEPAAGATEPDVRVLLHLALEPLVLTDAEGRIRAASEATSRLIRCAPTYSVGKPLDAFVVAEDRPRFRARLAACRDAHDERVRGCELRLGAQRRGEPRSVRVRVRRLGGPEESPALLWHFQDHTRERALEAQLARERDEHARVLGERLMESEAVARMQASLLAEVQVARAAAAERLAVARDLAVPLTTLLLASDLLAQRAREGMDVPAVREGLAEIGDAARRLADRVDALGERPATPR